MNCRPRKGLHRSTRHWDSPAEEEGGDRRRQDDGTGEPVYEVVAEFSNRTQAETARELLRRFGIEGIVAADDLGGMGPGQSFVRGVRLVVPAGERERAFDVLHWGQR